MAQAPRKDRMVQAKLDGQWRFVTEYRLQPNNSILIESSGKQVLVSAGDWKFVNTTPSPERGSEFITGDPTRFLDAHLADCRCDVCSRRRRRDREGESYSTRDRIELFVLGFLATCFVMFIIGVLWVYLR